MTWEADYKPNRFVALEDEVWKQNISSVCWLLLTAHGNVLWRRDELRKELAGLQREIKENTEIPEIQSFAKAVMLLNRKQ